MVVKLPWCILVPIVLLSGISQVSGLQSTSLLRRDAFDVTKPAAGDTVSTPFSEYTDYVQIEWTVAADTSNRPVAINLRRGLNASDLEAMQVVTAGTPNNGSFRWYARGADGFDRTLWNGYMDSACNYTLELKIWSEVAYSSFFTIVNLKKDGGVKAGAWCPIDHGILRVDNNTTEVIDVPTKGGSAPPTSSSTSSPGSTETDISSNNITSITLALAVAIPIVFLLATFAFIFFYGVRRKRWFLSGSATAPRKPESEELMGVPREKSGITTNVADAGSRGGEQRWEVDGKGQHHQADGTAIHQLMGDEEWRGNRYT